MIDLLRLSLFSLARNGHCGVAWLKNSSSKDRRPLFNRGIVKIANNEEEDIIAQPSCRPFIIITLSNYYIKYRVLHVCEIVNATLQMLNKSCLVPSGIRSVTIHLNKH